MKTFHRHPAEVTSDRLRLDYERYFNLFTANELDAIGIIRTALMRIAEGSEMEES